MAMEIPEHLRTGPLAEAAARALQDAASMAASSNSVPRLSLSGREFHLNKDGEEVGKFIGKLDVIILGVEPSGPLMIKTWYKNGYTPGAKEPPTCSSEDGITPSQYSQEKQSQTCATCPKNQFGSAISPSKKPTKACRDSKRIWFKVAPGNKILKNDALIDFEEGLLPFSERTLFGANITVASLKAFSDHGKALASLGQGPAVCVTRMKMLDGVSYPQLEFEIQSWLDAETAPLSLKMAEDRPWKVQFKNAGLALAMGDNAGNQTRSALPMQVPDHLKNINAEAQMAGNSDVTDARETSAKGSPSISDVDDAVGNW
jgi:hypothetical protein